MTRERIEAIIEASRRHLTAFTQATYPKYQRTTIHELYLGVLNAFAHGRIKNLIISMPPQHGKTEISSRRLPAYMLGLDPDRKIAIASYSQQYARRIGREVRRIVDDPKYRYIFPNTRMAASQDKGYTNGADMADIVGHDGSLMLAGRGSGMTGYPLDAIIFDDLYKNAMEANSPIIRESVIEYYKTVAETRLHNDSQQLIVFTRWHQEDLVGWLESQGIVDDLTDIRQLDDSDPTRWLKLNYPAIKEGPKTELDPRDEGEALWPSRHSKARLEAKREQDQEVFDSLYQGNPKPSKGLLYEGGFQLYDNLPDTIIERWSYTDTADEGSDYLCSLVAVGGAEGGIYIIDAIYTQEAQEITEPLVADMLIKTATETAWIESNAGGRAFARNVQTNIDDLMGRVSIKWYHQSKNKEARILTNSASVKQNVFFPRGWEKRWPALSRDLLSFKRLFRANTHDDAPDCLTGLYEKWENKMAGKLLEVGAGPASFGL